MAEEAEEEKEEKKEEKTEEPKKKKSKKGKGCLILILLGVGFLVLIGLIGSGGEKKTQEKKSAQPEEAETGTVEEKQPEEPLFPQFENGIHVVGEDIQPGTYRTRIGSSGCYYARLSGFGGTIDEIITNENTNYPAVITIAATDKGFKSTRCGTWTQDLSAITTNQTTFEDGIYIVGTDIEPGTYKSSGQTGCYYARLSGFGGTIDEIITNENTDDPAIVTIAATDKGFRSTRCGTWTKM